jgi:hypothetical protein
MLGKEGRNVALSDKKKRMWVHKCLRIRKSEGEYWTAYKELADNEMKFYQYFRIFKQHFNYQLQKINFATCIFIIFYDINVRPK